MRFDNFKKLNLKDGKTRIAAIIIAVLLLSLVVGISAKYIYDTIGEKTQAVALDFYFTIDALGDTNEMDELETDIHLFGGGEKNVAFAVQNYFDTLRINEKDIKYTVELQCNDAGYENKAVFTQEPDNYTMEASSGRHQDEFIVKLPTGYEQQGKTVTVTAVVKSSSPYVKEMKLNFVLHSEDAPLTYRVEDNTGDNFATLIVMSNDDIPAGKLLIDWSAINQSENVLQIDTTSPHVLDGTLELDSNDPSTSFLKQVTTTRSIAKGESIQIYFFKSNPNENYNIPDTAVTPVSGIYNISIVK